MMTMFAHLNVEQKPCAPVVSTTGQIVRNADSKTDAAWAYNEAPIATAEALAKPGAIHYLDCVTFIPNEGGYTKFMALCFVHCYCRGTSLQSIGKAA